MKKRKLLKISIFLMIAVFVITSFSPIKANDKKVIRVAYAMQNGLSMKDEDGNYYGYDYDYLMQIAQYTGWEYEFVEVEGNLNERITKLMDMLEKGEIDLMGDMKYMDSMASRYDYASEPYGNVYNVIATQDDSEILDVNTLANKAPLRIAVLNSSKRVDALEQFAQMSGFEYELIKCESEADMRASVEAGSADALLSVSLSVPNGYHSIARFSPEPFYFITTKGNTEIIQKLNQALTNINQINPTLSSTLYNRYFSSNTSNFALSASEKKFITDHEEINALVCDGNAPVQYLIDGEYYGVGKDILDYMSTQTGLKIKYTHASSYADYEEKAKSGEYDILLGLPYEVKLADSLNMNLSDPYLSGNLLLITNKSIDPSELTDKKQGVIRNQTQHYDNNTDIIYYESNADILKAINSKEIDYAYVNSYLVTYYTNKYELKDISTFTVPDYLRSQYAFATIKNEDLSLLGILNKSIRSQSDMLENYIYKNAYVEREFNLSTFLKENLISVVACILIGLAFVLYLLHAYYTKQLKMKKAVELEYQRYQILSDISGEMLFSYDFQKDEFKVSNSGIQKITQEEVTENFFTVANQAEAHEIIKFLYKYLLDKKDIISELETSLDGIDKRWYQISIKIINSFEKDEANAKYAVGKIVDIQKEKEEHEELRLKSQTDILTGLLNRGGGEDHISQALKQCEQLGALLMIDLDNFKDINDTYGHMEGDITLSETASLLKEVFAEEIIARLGGDEFVVYIKDMDKELIIEKSKQLLEKIHTLPCMKGKDFALTMSIGIVFTTFSRDYKTLLKKADEKMYEVKRQGRNSYIVEQE